MFHPLHIQKCCKILKPITQAISFISPIPLVQFNWYLECGGDNDEALTWGRDLINLFFPKDVYKHSLFFFLTLPSWARQCFWKEQKEKKRLCTGYVFSIDLWSTCFCNGKKSSIPSFHYGPGIWKFLYRKLHV